MPFYKTLLSTTILSFGASSVLADAPQVVTDIAPIHSLVAQVMEGVGTPASLVPANSSAHNFSLRPSDAKKIQDADLIVWMGPSLLPGMENTLDNLALNAHRLDLLALSGDRVLEYGAGDDHADHDGHKDHDDHKKHDDHADHDDHAGHDHSAGDPHAWLDPSLVAGWLPVIAEELAEHDPENAALYRSNAAKGIERLTSLSASISGQLGADPDTSIVVFHDALAYFARAFSIGPVLTIPLGDGQGASVADALNLQEMAADHAPKCALIDPGGSSKALEQLASDLNLELKTLDVLGAGVPLGPNLYDTVLTDVAATVAACQ